MTESFTLNFYPWNQWNKYKHLIVDAKKQTGVTTQVIPQEATPGCGRVICVEPPPFLCDYALIQSGSVAGFTAALLWFFGIKEDDRVITVAQTLSQIMGGKVVEHLEERDYGDRLINPEPTVLVDKDSSVEHRPRKTDGDSAGYLW
jgi:hypothetical protein